MSHTLNLRPWEVEEGGQSPHREVLSQTQNKKSSERISFFSEKDIKDLNQVIDHGDNKLKADKRDLQLQGKTTTRDARLNGCWNRETEQYTGFCLEKRTEWRKATFVETGFRGSKPEKGWA